MALEKWVFDGWDGLDGLARGWEYRSGTDVATEMTGANADLPNRSGQMWRPKWLGQGGFTLAVWLAGGTTDEAQASWRTLLRAVHRPHRLVHIERTLASGEVVTADAEVSGKIEPTHIGQLGMRAQISFVVPSGVWASKSTYTQQTAAGAALPQTLTLTSFEPSTAAMEGLTFTIKGKVVDATIVDTTDGVDGDSVKYTGTIASGQSLTLNASTWQATGSGFTPNQAAVAPSGRRLMTVVAARPGQTPTVQLRGTGAGDATTQLVVTGRRIYLC